MSEEVVEGVKKTANKDHIKQIVDMQNGHPTLVELWTSSLDDPPPDTFTSEKKTLIEMERKSEYNPSMCCHYKIKLQNSEKPVIIYVKTPNSRCFSVTPKVDLIEPNSEKWIFFSYDSRSCSLPDDFTFAFTIYQIEVQNSKLLETLKKEWETHSRKTLRETWQSHSHRPCTFLLWLPVVFHQKPTKGRSCTRRHSDYLPKLLFDTKGHKIKDEEVYDPAKHDEKEDEDLPSAEQDGDGGKKMEEAGGEGEGGEGGGGAGEA